MYVVSVSVSPITISEILSKSAFIVAQLNGKMSESTLCVHNVQLISFNKRRERERQSGRAVAMRSELMQMIVSQVWLLPILSCSMSKNWKLSKSVDTTTASYILAWSGSSPLPPVQSLSISLTLYLVSLILDSASDFLVPKHFYIVCFGCCTWAYKSMNVLTVPLSEIHFTSNQSIHQ